MNRVGKFEKVSFEQFHSAMKEEFGGTFEELLEVEFEEATRKAYDNLELPKRATSGSAGYDFKAPIRFSLQPGQSIKIPTGIRVQIEDGWWLGCLPRSGLGFKYRMQLDNSVGVIDSDFFYSDNEGHIFAKITNDGKEGKALAIEAGDGFIQAIFLPYGITYDDDVKNVRNGGMGSTGA